MPRPNDTTDDADRPQSPPPLDDGEHDHAGQRHVHPHHHTETTPTQHDHSHAQGFERHTYLCSPIHSLDPRFKIVAAFALILGIVLGPPLRPLEFAFMVMLFVAVTLLSHVPLSWMLKRSLLVLPVAGGIALFAPLGDVTSWTAEGISQAYSANAALIWSIVSKAWLSTFTVLLVSATTPPPLLFKALKALRMPSIFLTMLTFLYRYTDIMRGQLHSLGRSVASRAPRLRGWSLLALYGNLAGNMFIRAYDRGDRIHAAMLARGYDGTLPTAEKLSAGPADALLVGTALLAVAAVLLY